MEQMQDHHLATMSPYQAHGWVLSNAYNIVAQQVPGIVGHFRLLLHGDAALLRVTAEFIQIAETDWTLAVPLETARIEGRFYALQVPDWAVTMLLLRMP